MQAGGIVVLDYGSQYTQLIARRIRAQRVFSQILPFSAEKGEVLGYKPKGIVLSGGPCSVFDESAPQLPGYLIDLGLPVLGVCYGMQLLSRNLGARVERAGRGEYGSTTITRQGESRLLEGTPREQRVWMSHGDKIVDRPPGIVVAASSEGCEVAAFEVTGKRIFGVQFHPEVHHSEHGEKILANFLFSICECEQSWLPESIIEDKVKEIRATVGGGRVMCAVSGGVDSSVTACLVDRAVGKNLLCVFVDNGLLREGERESVPKLLGEHLSSEPLIIDASRRFLDGLRGVSDPEEKRKRIGNLFIEVFEEVSEGRGPFDFLAQGTLYPDRIESRSTHGPSATIKTHHNVGGLPEELNFQLIEPLALLFKDEVREIGLSLGLPEEQVGRHPFPGPGLAVRVLGEVTREKLSLLRRADKIFIDGLKRWNLYGRIWQAGAVLLPVQSVGVMGDARTYNYVVALRAVTSTDGMTADWAELDNEFLKEISNAIINSVRGINRVVYDISSKPPSTIEWE